jgi:hypothetical protein
MQTKKEVVDRIKSKLRQMSKDRWMSNRFILKILEEKTRNLLSQKLRDRSLYRESNLYSTINCFEFENIDTFSCDIVEFKTCQSIMKSNKKLPELIYSRFGDSIRIVSNLDQTERLQKTTPPDYYRSRKRKFNNNPPMFYERGGYLYLLNTHMEVGFVELLTLDTETSENIDCNCGDTSCKSSLDYPFIGSDKLKETVIQQTLQELLQTYLQIQVDENPDNNENSV